MDMQGTGDVGKLMAENNELHAALSAALEDALATRATSERLRTTGSALADALSDRRFDANDPALAKLIEFRIALDAAPTPDARLREAVAALRAKTDQHGGVPWLEPELGAVYAALDAAPAETGEQLAARLTDRMRARDAAESGEAVCRSCGRPFSPTHDASAPGPTSRHIFKPTRHP
jgi:hypothetical protein